MTLGLILSNELTCRLKSNLILSNSAEIVTVTIFPTISTSFVPTPTQLASSKEKIPKTAVIAIAVVVPLITCLAGIIFWRVKGRRWRGQKSQDEKGDRTLHRLGAKISELWKTKNESIDDLPWQMPDEDTEIKSDLYTATRSSPSVATPTRQMCCSPSNSVSSPLPRSSVPGSSSKVTRECAQNGRQDATGAGRKPLLIRTPGLKPLLSDGNANKIIREAHLDQDFGLDKRSPPNPWSQRDGVDRHKSLTPEPLRIVKNSDSMTTVGDLLNASRGILQKPYPRSGSEAGDASQMTIQSLEQELMEELNSIGDHYGDEETRRMKHEDTLNYLESVIPGSPASAFRASSVYSRNEWGSPILGHEEGSLSNEGQNAATTLDNGGNIKGKAVDRSEVEGGWI